MIERKRTPSFHRPDSWKGRGIVNETMGLKKGHPLCRVRKKRDRNERTTHTEVGDREGQTSMAQGNAPRTKRSITGSIQDKKAI